MGVRAYISTMFTEYITSKNADIDALVQRLQKLAAAPTPSPNPPLLSQIPRGLVVL